MCPEPFEVRQIEKSAFRLGVRRTLCLVAFSSLVAISLAAVQPALPSESADTQTDVKVPPPRVYAGDAACSECHVTQARSYAATPHATDSSIASEKTILGDFNPQNAVLRTGNPSLAFVMLSTPEGFYQSAVNLSDPQHISQAMKRFDIVVGSGRHGQTYLYWDGDQLFELPVSWWTYAHRWVDSPGYPDGVLHWDRPARPRCLECHANYFTTLAMPNHYVKDSLVLGIGCERCHGPGALHVSRERSAAPPAPGSPNEAIVNPAHLTRDQQIGLCTLCHAGQSPSIKPALTYVVGDNIKDYIEVSAPPADKPVDVHGNQVGALVQSKCFTSVKLTCSTCHNVHKTQEKADAFSGHCLECHKVTACGRYHTMGDSIRGHCVDCHMPLGKSNAIKTATGLEQQQATFRAHRIAIYPDATLEPAEK
jgi:hypothetical protein